MNPLREAIQKQIARQGVISFEKFMELALYCPELGYYERSTASIGRGGDFITSVSVGRLFGELLAFQFAEWLRAVPGPLQLIEAGAHDGRLLCDVAGWFHENEPALSQQIELCLVEPSAARRWVQQSTLAAHAGRVRWLVGWTDFEAHSVNGVIFSNELLDAFPIRRLGWDARRHAWFEWGVAADEGRFVWTRMKPADGGAELLEVLCRAGYEIAPALLEVLPDGFTVECSPAAVAWWRGAAAALGCGKLMAIDYGAEAGELLRPERAGGTLRAYAGHRSVTDPLADPGEQDLTAHVNFSAIRLAGEQLRLETECFESQERFLTRIAGRIWRRDTPAGNWTFARGQQFRTLTHPDHLGRPFRVLVQSRRGC